MEPIRRPSGRRVLLPYEIDLCESLGITAEEYWDFIFTAQETLKGRGKEYDLVPDVRNDPVTLFVVNLVIGIAMTAISALLAPKPKAPNKRDPRRLDIAGSQGQQRYTKSNNFDSVQQLASLGEIIPLVFAERRGEYGGIRVDTDMLHSQLITSGNSQVLWAVMMFGLGKLGEAPDLNGFAIGDLLLRDFDPAKYKLYFKDSNGDPNRIKSDDDYDDSDLDVPNSGDDAFPIYWPRSDSWQPFFSGVRTPSSKTQFGCHNPIANGHRFYVPLELVMVIDFSGNQAKEDSRAKRDKVARPYPSLCGLTKSWVQGGRRYVEYKVDGLNMSGDPARTDPDWARPWGLSDVASTNDERRIEADERLQPNQDMMIGSTLGRVVRRNQSGIWAPELNTSFTYTIRLDENVSPDMTGNGSLQDEDDKRGGAFPWARAAVQQAAVASLTNNRPCHATEIGIKSEVWRQLTGAVNKNGFPTPDTIEEYEHEGGQISVGSVTKYTKRYSFFTLYARELGADNWVDITGSAVFAVRGTSPLSQYNTIHIEHPQFKAYEYRIVPVPGAKFYDRWLKGDEVGVKLLTGSELSKDTSRTHETPFGGNKFRVCYTGKEHAINQADAGNSEWILNSATQEPGKKKGPIAQLDPTDNGKPIKELPLPNRSSGIKYNTDPNNRSMVLQKDKGVFQYWWKGQKKSGTDTDFGWRHVDAQGRVWLYNRREKKIDYVPERWEDSNDSPAYVVDRVFDVATGEGLTTLVYKNPFESNPNRQWIWKWNGNIVHRASSLTGVWQEQPGGKTRYRTAKGDDGKILKPVTEESYEYVRDEEKVNLYRPNGTNKRPWTGARLVVSGTWAGYYEFFKNNAFLGRSRSRYLYLKNNGQQGQRGKDDRWFADTIQKDYMPEIRESQGRIRDCDPDKNKAIALVVVDGCAIQEFMKISNPNGNGQKKEVRRCKIMVGGDKVYDGPLFDWYGQKYKHKIGNKEYNPVLDGDYIKCGPTANRSDVAKLQVDKITAEQLEEWSITWQLLQIVPESYAIEKQKLEDEIEGQFSIEEERAERTEPEEPDVYTTNLNAGGNTTAKVRVKEYKKSKAFTWELVDNGKGYEVDEICKVGATGEETRVAAINSGKEIELTTVGYGGMIAKGNNYFPLNAVCDYFINTTDTSSHANGPEHNVIFCNEIIRQDDQNPPQYKDLALAGIKVTNSKEWTSFNSLSAWIAKGIEVEHLLTGEGRGATGCTSLFPEIAYALLTDDRIGAGKLIGAASVDRDAMVQAARFCKANNFFWDGVIAENLNLREFIFQNAGFILCDFTIKGGKFALVPSVPVTSQWVINPKGKPDIRALFTDSNMRNMKVTWLSPEQRQPFKAVVLYREEKENSFAETRTMTVRLAGGQHDSDPTEEFDLTQWCTSEAQARWFARVALKLREKVDHGITFETTPQSAMNMEPGQYFKVASKVTHTDRFQSGSVTDDGTVISTDATRASSFRVVYWRPGDTATYTATLTFSQGKTNQTALWGTLWAKVVESENTRVYKVETLSYSDDGLVSVSGSHVPLTNAGTLAILDWDPDKAFVEELA